MELAIVFKKNNINGQIYFEPVDTIKKEDKEDGFIYNGNVLYHMLSHKNKENEYFYGMRIKNSKCFTDTDLEDDLENLKTNTFKLDTWYGKEIILLSSYDSEQTDIFTDQDTDEDGFFKEEESEVFDINYLYNRITSIVKGQENQIKSILATLYFHYNNIDKCKGNILIAGKTGVGKTRVFQEIEKELNVPVIIIDVTTITESGYQGDEVNSILEKLILKTNGNQGEIDKAIVCLDEIDKLMEKSGSDDGVKTYGVAQSLLKLVEGKKEKITINDENYEVDTSKILFVGIGSFARMFGDAPAIKQIGFEKDLTIDNYLELTLENIVQKKAMIPELAGRFENFITFNSLTKDIYIDILLNSEESPLKIWKSMLEKENITLKFNPVIIKYIALKANENSFGVRSMISEVNKIMKKISIEIAFNKDKYDEIYLDIDDNQNMIYDLGVKRNELTRNRKSNN